MTSPQSAHSQYRLAPHVHVCRAGPHVMLLDLRRNRYFGVNELESMMLRRHIEGWPEKAEESDTSSSSDESGLEMLRQMIDEGMLTRDLRTGKSAVPAFIARPDKPLIEGYEAVPPNIRAADVMRFLYASTVATLQLRRRRLEYVTARVQSRKLRRSPCHTSSVALSESDIVHLRRLLAIFRTLRPLLFTANDKCLFNSLALSEFLAGYGFFPQWVFGVATKPFRAHCWLQQNRIVFDDIPGHVNNFTPIMAV